jgi:diadenosine tetraphosphate (Ap4A) HIT family hydrolase
MALAESKSPQARAENTALARTENFCVIPASGPLVLGHVMAISQSHTEHLSNVNEGTLIEYQELRTRAEAKLLASGLDLLEIEHGSTSQNYAGGCIVHTHLHWLPGLGEVAEEFERRLPLIGELGSLAELRQIDEPYLLVRKSGTPYFLYSAKNLPSQYSRRIVAAHLNLESWDWVVSNNSGLVLETIEFWRGLGPR